MEKDYPGSASQARTAQDLDGLKQDAERETRGEHGEGEFLRLGGRSVHGGSGCWVTPITMQPSCHKVYLIEN
jgi:hypothetical protein